MIHSILRKLMLIAVLLTGSHAFAHDFEVDGIYYNILSSTDLMVEVTEGSNEYTGSVVIPENVIYSGTTYSVTHIGHGAFTGCSGLTSITIPNSVTSIGDSTFRYCRGLTTITIGNGVTSIGNSAFYHCYDLKSATIGNSVVSIGDDAFTGCSDLTSITISNSVTSIGVHAFDGCSGLTSVTISNLEAWCKINFSSLDSNPTFYSNNLYLNGELLTDIEIPNTITEIKNYTFYGCSGLTNITIPDSVTNIGNWAFYKCTGLASITISKSVTSIGDCAFYGCFGLKNVTIGNSVASIGNLAFSYCTDLESIKVDSGNSIYDSRDNCNAVIETSTNTLITGCKNTTIPNSVTTIGNEAFTLCTDLTNITIPNSVTNICDWAFYKCTGLASITISNSVTSIGNWAFAYCSGLTEIICKSSTPPTVDNFSFSEVPTTATLYVPIGSKQAYANATGWSRFTNIVEKEMSGVESTLIDNDVNVVVENGNIVVIGANGENVEVYSTSGQCVYNGTATTIPVPTKALYIVKVNGKSFKVIL